MKPGHCSGQWVLDEVDVIGYLEEVCVPCLLFHDHLDRATHTAKSSMRYRMGMLLPDAHHSNSTSWLLDRKCYSGNGSRVVTCYAKLQIIEEGRIVSGKVPRCGSMLQYV